MESKEIKQSFSLEEVSPTAEISEEIDQSLEEYKRVVLDKLVDISLPMRDIQHRGTLFFMISKILSCGRRVSKMKVLNSSSSYHLLSACGRNVFYKVCQISSPIILRKVFFVEVIQ